MLLGGSVTEKFSSPEEWIAHVKRMRFAAVTAPITHQNPDRVKYAEIAKENGVLIAEVGVWRNTISPDDAIRKDAMDYAKHQLAFAEEIGAPCCVNIVGATGETWDGCYPENYSSDVYALIVDSIHEIINAVKPTRTCYSIEPMPWMVPDGPDEYLQLIKDVDSPAFGVHMDYVNMINCPKRYLFAPDFVRECFTKLGKYIKSVHAKDVKFHNKIPAMMEEVAPGQGSLNYAAILKIIDELMPKSTPVLLEHMSTSSEYTAAYNYLAGIAGNNGIAIR